VTVVQPGARNTDDSLPKVSVVVPAYRSPGTLQRLVEEVDRALEPITSAHEIIFVDDGSGDGTWEQIVEIGETHEHVRGLSLLRNFGQHNALLAGLREARLPIIVTIDDDLQNPPSEIPVLLRRLQDAEIDLVYGTPRDEKQTRMRNIASIVSKRMMAQALGPEVYPKASAFRAFRRELLVASDGVQNPHISIDVLLSWATVRVDHVDVEFDVRENGTSGYTFRALIRHALNMITGYSTRPLRWVSFLGFGCATMGFLLLAYVLVRNLVSTDSVAGFTFLAAAITLFSGVQLLSLGVLGEYIGRMHFRTMGKPPYAIRRRTGPASDDD
jgi:glycosyltransferase involved in cell wall biosynthesis